MSRESRDLKIKFDVIPLGRINCFPTPFSSEMCCIVGYAHAQFSVDWGRKRRSLSLPHGVIYDAGNGARFLNGTAPDRGRIRPGILPIITLFMAPSSGHLYKSFWCYACALPLRAALHSLSTRRRCVVHAASAGEKGREITRPQLMN